LTNPKSKKYHFYKYISTDFITTTIKKAVILHRKKAKKDSPNDMYLIYIKSKIY
jgi:hypothetical protein